jgi:hypothetical protein
MDEKTTISIPSNPQAVAEMLDNYSGDWFEALKFLAGVADEQGVYFDKSAVTKMLASKYAEPV